MTSDLKEGFQKIADYAYFPHEEYTALKQFF